MDLSTTDSSRLGSGARLDKPRREISEEDSEKMRKAKELKAQLAREGDIIARSLMPKKRLTSGPLLEVADLDEEPVQPASEATLPSAPPPTRPSRDMSHLQRHNEARRKHRSKWNLSWNHHRALQEHQMGRRIVGQERFEQQVGRGGGSAELTSVMTPMGAMSRTDALLTALSSRDVHHDGPGVSWGSGGGWVGGVGPHMTGSRPPFHSPGGGGGGDHGLMRTTALLQNLMGGGGGFYEMDTLDLPFPNAKRHRTVSPTHYDSFHDNQRPHHYDNQHQQHFQPSPRGWSEREVFVPDPATVPMHHRTPLDSADGLPPTRLSRTEQLLGVTAGATRPFHNGAAGPGIHAPLPTQPYGLASLPAQPAPPQPHFFPPPSGNGLQPPMQPPHMHAHTQQSRRQRVPFVPSLQTGKAPPTPPVAAGGGGGDKKDPSSRGSDKDKCKMNAGDLYAMLLATGILPAKGASA